MRKNLILLFWLIGVLGYASEPLKIGVISDIHYLSKSLKDDRYMTQDYVQNTGRDVIALPDILDKVLDDYTNNNIDVLLISGDLTKDGEKQSHLDLADLLKPLHEKGIKIFVVPGNHDINMPNSLKYQGNKKNKTENISKADFENIYNKYGFGDAIFRNMTTLSYVAPLSDDVWLLSIDAANYNNYSTERASSSGAISNQVEEWIEFVLEMAQKRDKQVVAMMHWGVVEHFPLQLSTFKDYLITDHKRLANLLADNGVRIVFTGHFHANDISQYTTEKGNTIYDIETGALVSYPFAYRFVDLYSDKAVIKTKNIDSLERYPNFVKNNKTILKRIAKGYAENKLKSTRFKFSDDATKQLADVASEIYILHLLGDEKVDDNLKKKLIGIFQDMEFPVDKELNNFDIELLPADNNVTIYFD